MTDTVMQNVAKVRNMARQLLDLGENVSDLTIMAKLLANFRVPSHVSGIRCVFAQNHESERDALTLLSLSLSWFCAKTQRIPDIHGMAP